MAAVPPLPASLKAIQHYIKTASEHDKRDPIVAYYCRLYSLQKAMEIDKKSPEARTWLMGMMDVLEKSKTELAGHEAIATECVGQAHIENYALKLFLYADNEDRAGRFGKNVVKSFYTAGMVMDVLQNFGELSEDIEKNRKYAKWKAAYIHNCLKNGETPHAGPLEEEGGGDSLADTMDDLELGPSTSQGPHQSSSGSVGYPPQGPPSSYQQPSSSWQPPAAPAAVPKAAPAPAPVAAAAGGAGATANWHPPPNASGVTLTAKQYQQGMKLCKYAMSAMQYEDAPTAIENLVKALNLMSKGHE